MEAMKAQEIQNSKTQKALQGQESAYIYPQINLKRKKLEQYHLW